MRIVWNKIEAWFELEFDKSNFQNDLACAKAAKFKTTGPPNWIWWSDKIKNLEFLKANKPSGNLTITDEARAKFNELKEAEDKKQAVLKQARDIQARLAGKPTEDERRAKREEREKAREAKGLGPVVRKPQQAKGGSRYIPPETKKEFVPHKFTPPPLPSERCIFCNDPVYGILETILPLPICHWCEKTITDIQGPDKDLTNDWE